METTCQEVTKPLHGYGGDAELVMARPGAAAALDLKLLLGFVAAEPFVPVARKATVQALDQDRFSAEAVSDVATIVTELVANAVTVSVGRWIEVRVGIKAPYLVVDVWDPSEQMPATVRCPGDEEINGRGLLIIAALSTAWEIVPTPDRGGKRVVAYMTVSDPPLPEPPAA
ncbi:ATP-binding protein [Actinocorallia longicatena]|uniref:Histidine kinase/HSP90-like ATPase domain-containing protein n=1 Tax=Actinocorallia longicatena TaxID=111803 RepID=A0ABP6QGS1_9ACTN